MANRFRHWMVAAALLFAGCMVTPVGNPNDPEVEGLCSTSTGIWPPPSKSDVESCSFSPVTAKEAIEPNIPTAAYEDFELKLTLDSNLRLELQDPALKVLIERGIVQWFAEHHLPILGGKPLFQHIFQGEEPWVIELDSLNFPIQREKSLWGLVAYPKTNALVRLQRMDSAILYYWVGDVLDYGEDGSIKGASQTYDPFPLARYEFSLEFPMENYNIEFDSLTILAQGSPWSKTIGPDVRELDLPGFSGISLPLFLVAYNSMENKQYSMHMFRMRERGMDSLAVDGEVIKMGLNEFK